ncbi:MAG: Guanylate kinase [Candidatus Amesbacteria bacterium GW2011_GWA2_42_12]|uniref:Guanylate kinase n=1 Tax=Candidatus Amesbacteria bacterium GW2011_GWA2_42_12 TaxID=1618356 RepID=A0A0G0Y8Q9_9BACT|nr:MAG: Guanylate kinase [Candidatus Amesbacteria bacterium GW2011_GWA2_42_12]
MKNEGLRIVITGPSGVGKDTVMNTVKDRLGDRAQRVVTYTDRSPRPGEVNHVDYHFISTSAFKEMIEKNELLEYKDYGGCYKGTAPTSVHVDPGKVLIWRIDPTMAARVLNRDVPVPNLDDFVRTTVVCYLGVPSLFNLKTRQARRGEKLDSVRLREDWKVWENHGKIFLEKGHVIINEEGKMEQTVQAIMSLLN